LPASSTERGWPPSSRSTRIARRRSPRSREADGLRTQPDADLLERELRVAQRIQRTLVQLAGIEADGWEITSEYRPARSIGGDFFDVFPILDPARPRQLGVVIADVSGKGISAALLMAFVRPVMRSALDRSADPVEALERTNQILVEERQTGLFVTLLAGVLELDTGIFSFANAGHELPLIVPGDGSEPRALPGGGPLVGMFARLGVQLERVRIEPGDALVLYTDGVTDARAAGGERFGEDRFRAALRRVTGGTTPAPCRDVIDQVLAFQGEGEPADDLALLVLRRRSS
jgi:sigma-B regulation protein RsbU (phosphoserine phosphatase)